MTTLPPPPSGLIVMYHYVRPDRSNTPAGIRPLLVSEFESQLDWLCERYDVLSAERFLEQTCRGAGASVYRSGFESRDVFSYPHTPILRHSHTFRPPKPPCLLTFDDGTKDHAQIVTPILARRGLSGVFFVLSGPAQHGQMPLTHAIHWLLSGDEQAVWESFQRYAQDHLYGLDALGNPAEARRIYHYESPVRASIKYAANMALPSEATESIVDAALRATGRTTRELAAEWFVSSDDIFEMDAAGMTIAAHGRTHQSLQTLGPTGIRREIQHCSAFVHGVTGSRPTWYACPFGGAGASAQAVAGMRNAMKECGIVASVSTEKRYADRGSDPLALPRMDTIDLPPRRREAMAA